MSRMPRVPQVCPSSTTAKVLSPIITSSCPGSHRLTTRTRTSACSGVVRWRRPSLTLVAGVRVGTDKKGNA